MFKCHATLLTLLVSLAYFPWSGRAETCTPLELVGGRGNQVTKTVTIPSVFGVNRTNWNTDWIVPSHHQFKRFEANITSEQNNSYQIKMYLKYSDGTASEFYSRKEVLIRSGTPLKIPATPRVKEQHASSESSDWRVESNRANLFCSSLRLLLNWLENQVIGLTTMITHKSC